MVVLMACLIPLIAAYLYFGLVPGRLKIYAVRLIEKHLPVKVEFTKAIYLPFKGLSLHHLKVWDKHGLPIFSAKRFSMNVRILPLLREKKIIVSSVQLNAPVYDVVLEKEGAAPPPPPPMTKISGQIPVPVVPDRKKVDISTLEEGPDAFLPENVTLEEIQITNGLVRIRKNKQSPPGEILSGIKVRMAFRKPPLLTFDGSLKLGDKPYATVTLRGDWNLSDSGYNFYFETKSELVPQWLLEYQSNNFLILQSGGFTLESHLQSREERRAQFRAKANLKNAKILLNKADYSGEMALDVAGLFDFESRKFEKYRGALELVHIRVLNLSKDIPRLDGIDGKIEFEPGLLAIQSVRGQYKNIPFEAQGHIQSFQELNLHAFIRTGSSIPQVLSLLPEGQKKVLSPFQIQGDCQAITEINGSLKKASLLSMQHKLLIENGAIYNAEKKIDLKKLTAEILANNDAFEVKSCAFSAADKRYSLSAFIPKKAGAPGSLQLSSDDLRLSSSYLLNEKHIRVDNAKVSHHGMDAQFSGTISDVNLPRLDIEGQAEIHLGRLLPFLADQNPSLKDAGLEGTLKGLFALKGIWNDPLSWDFKTDAKADSLLLKRMRLQNVDIQIRTRNRIINIPYFHGAAYGGTFGYSGFFDLARNSVFFDGKIYGNAIDLRGLAQDLKSQNKDLAGSLTFQTTLNGFLKSQETFRGNGAADIRNGNLWRSDLFKQMGSLPFVKVLGMEEVVFTDLSATFDIHDKKIWTENLNLMSSGVALRLKGSVGFDQNLDLLMNIRYSPDILRGAEDTGGFVPLLIQEAEEFISEYRIRGTLKEPKYEKVPLPVGKVVGKKISSLFRLGQ